MSLKPGDVVKIKSLPIDVNEAPDAVAKYNPRNVKGIVVEVGGGSVKGLPVRVKWQNGYFNRYAGNNLEKIDRKKA